MNITKEQFMEKYGNKEVSFVKHCDYYFHFNGVLDRGYIVVLVSEDNDDINRLKISEQYIISSLTPEVGIIYKNRTLVESYYAE